MTTATLVTTPADATNVASDAEGYTRIVKIIRNMTDFKRIENNKVVTASNRHPGQTHTRTEIDGAMNHELAMARYLMQDLADHIFGHIVSTELARDILQKFVQDKHVQVFDESSPRNLELPLDPTSDDAQKAIQQAFERTDWYDCIRDTQSYAGETESSSTNTKGKGKQKEKTFSFRWITFPMEPLHEDELVSFLNDITDRAFAFAKPRLAVPYQKLHHRFAAPEDKHHAMLLSYEPDGEDMRPDFLLLPIEAFSDDFKTVNPKYVNFTASRLVGESKNKDLAAGVEQMQRYGRGLKRAQPWVYYVLGMTVTKDKAVFMRGEGSGTEHLELVLTDGRGCIEFMRILLGLALADKVDLGHNPDVVLERREQACKARNVTRRSNASTAKAMSRQSGNDQVTPVSNPLSRVRMSETQSATRPRNDSAAVRPPAIRSSSTKRDHSEIADAADERKQSKKRKTGENALEDVNRFVFYPVAVYGYECLGILFTASSIRGRGTTVFSVVDLKAKEKRLALKIAWQDVTRVAEQDAVMQHLTKQGSHPNVIVPLKTEKVKKDDMICTTLGAIRGFLDAQIETLGVENRVLVVSASELRRPVRYFWGVHDFVRGLRGALLGHKYLTEIGILHRDISENNIVLGLRPEDERGYLIDLDMAILQNAEEPTQPEPVKLHVPFSKRFKQKSSTLLQPDGKKPMRALRTGTFPYISYNVLRGGKHTQFDDVESFLYVLLLFFFSYAGPLSASELRQADEAGFVQPIGSGRPPHMKNWPKKYAGWADGETETLANQKFSAITDLDGVTDILLSAEFVDCLENNWPRELHDPICDLIEGSFTIFYNSTLRTAAKRSRTEVSHAEFVRTLDAWLDVYSDLEDKFCNCPFKDPEACAGSES
ncbi:hypothetical protein L210DRAFT_3531725 [Boletus edulis BED1]|uniref:Protein kinase domain-containing protein n=1 Tax=Boletus edulis BED1 TaxID=1328754 RepID=A0AAD4C0E2_BOLED|nr:hypothetical protein L210DRAFT_3531725 [Boletus edulis BED1]